MNDLARRMVMVGAVLVLQACRGDKPAEPVAEIKPKFRTTTVPCFLSAREPAYDGDNTGVGLVVRGPSYCERVLELFLREHPKDHIVSIVPIEYPAPPVETPGEAVHGEGTQELLILHADRGRWPVAESLKVRNMTCGTDAKGFGPKQCQSSIEFGLEFVGDVEFWVPLNSRPLSEKLAPGTSSLLMVERRASAVQK